MAPGPLVALVVSMSVALLTLACANGGSISPTAAATMPRLVVLYATCSVNRSFLSPYGPEAYITPRLAEFARDGIVFDRHWSEAGQSGVAFASIFSGAQMPTHGIYAHPTRMDDSVYLIGEAFAEAGYEVFFWGGHSMASGKWNYGQGAPPDNTFKGRLEAEDARFIEILDRLKRDPHYRAMVMTNFTVTHTPYRRRNLEEFCAAYPEHCELYERDPSALRKYAALHVQHKGPLSKDFQQTVLRLGYDEAKATELIAGLELLYKANINYLDRLFGSVLDRVGERGLTDESLIVFTSDHGESLHREKGLFYWDHGWQLSPDVLRVPFIVRGPKALGLSGRYSSVTRSIDVFPTLVGLSGIRAGAGLEREGSGVDLSSALVGGAPPPQLPAYSHTVLKHPRALKRSVAFESWAQYFSGIADGEMWVSLRHEDRFFKLRNFEDGHWGFQAFDLEQDPHAEDDVFDPDDPGDRRSADLLVQYQRILVDGYRASRDLPPLENEDVEALKALGYVQ